MNFPKSFAVAALFVVFGLAGAFTGAFFAPQAPTATLCEAPTDTFTGPGLLNCSRFNPETLEFEGLGVALDEGGECHFIPGEVDEDSLL